MININNIFINNDNIFLLIICTIIPQFSLVQFDFSYNETAPYNISLCIGRKDNCYPFLVSPMVTTTMVLSRRRFNPETSPTFTRISEDMNMGIYLIKTFIVKYILI